MRKVKFVDYRWFRIDAINAINAINIDQWIPGADTGGGGIPHGTIYRLGGREVATVMIYNFQKILKAGLEYIKIHRKFRKCLLNCVNIIIYFLAHVQICLPAKKKILFPPLILLSDLLLTKNRFKKKKKKRKSFKHDFILFIHLYSKYFHI